LYLFSVEKHYPADKEDETVAIFCPTCRGKLHKHGVCEKQSLSHVLDLDQVCFFIKLPTAERRRLA